MAFTNFKWREHLVALSQRFQRNKKNVNEKNIKLIFHFQLSHLFFLSVVYRLRGVVCGVQRGEAWDVG